MAGWQTPGLGQGNLRWQEQTDQACYNGWLPVHFADGMGLLLSRYLRHGYIIYHTSTVSRNQMSQETKVNKHSDTNTLDSYTLIGTQKNNGALFHF